MWKKGLEEDFGLLGAGNVNRWEQQRGAAGVHPPGTNGGIWCPPVQGGSGFFIFLGVGGRFGYVHRSCQI